MLLCFHTLKCFPDHDDDDEKDVMMMVDKDYEKGDDADYALVPLEKQVRGGRIVPVPQYSTPSFDHKMENLIVFNVMLIPTTVLNGELDVA